jgi:PKD repeat protein
VSVAIAGALAPACDGSGLDGPSGDAPVPAFSVECQGLSCSFLNVTVGAGATNFSYRWNFGDNTAPVTTRNATHRYALPGEFTVTLTVSHGDGSTGTSTARISVADPPTADFTHYCATLLCEFQDLSSSTHYPIAAWFWDFGDGQTSREPNPNHIYFVQQPTSFWVKLTVTDEGGHIGTATKQVVVLGRPYDPPVAAFSVSCAALICTCIDESTSGDVLNIWHWDFGDGHKSEAGDPSLVHVYDVTAQTRFTVTLEVCDSNINCDSVSKEILVTPGP